MISLGFNYPDTRHPTRLSLSRPVQKIRNSPTSTRFQKRDGTMIPNEKRLIDLTVGELREILKNERETSLNKIEIPPPTDNNQFLEMEEAAKVLHITKDTLYGICHRKEIKYSKPGKKNLFKMVDLLNYLEGGEVETLSDIENKMNNSILGKRNKMK